MILLKKVSAKAITDVNEDFNALKTLIRVIGDTVTPPASNRHIVATKIVIENTTPNVKAHPLEISGGAIILNKAGDTFLGNPLSDKGFLYLGTDKDLYYRNDSGNDFSLTGGGGGGGVTSIKVYSKYTLAENIAAGKVVAVNSNGRGILASKKDSLRAEVVGIAAVGGIIGDTINVQRIGQIGGLSGLTPGLNCLAGDSGKIIQSGDSVTVNQYRTYLGVATSATTLDINVGEATKNEPFYAVYDIEVKNDATIAGDLTVDGTTTTTNLSVSNIINPNINIDGNLTVGDTNILRGLVWYLPLNEGVGDSYIQDKSQSTVHAHAHGGVTMGGAGRAGNCATFDGAAGTYIHTASNVPAATMAFSLSCWIKCATPVGEAYAVCGGSTVPRFHLTVLGAIVAVFVDAEDSPIFLTTGPAVLSSTAWTHAVVTHDGTTAKLYLNGTVVDQETCSYGDYGGAQTYLLGVHPDLTSGRYSGSIDEVRLYNRAISSDEVLQLYNNPVSGNLAFTGTLNGINFPTINNIKENDDLIPNNTELFSLNSLDLFSNKKRTPVAQSEVQYFYPKVEHKSNFISEYDNQWNKWNGRGTIGVFKATTNLVKDPENLTTSNWTNLSVTATYTIDTWQGHRFTSLTQNYAISYTGQRLYFTGGDTIKSISLVLRDLTKSPVQIIQIYSLGTGVSSIWAIINWITKSVNFSTGTLVKANWYGNDILELYAKTTKVTAGDSNYFRIFPNFDYNGLIWSLPLNETTGDTTFDFSSNVINAHKHGGVTYGLPGIDGNCATFDGAAGTYIHTASNVPALGNAWTWSCWVKGAVPADYAMFITIFNDKQYVCVQPDGRIQVAWINSVGAWVSMLSVTTPAISASAWTHVVATHSGTTTTIYLNGTADNTASTHDSKSMTAGPMAIGTYDGTTYGFPGSIDEVRLYSRALSATEVLQLYNSPGAAKTVQVTAVQIEDSIYPTPYTQTSRAAGSLKYPITYPLKGTVEFWLRPWFTYYTSYSSNIGIFVIVDDALTLPIIDIVYLCSLSKFYARMLTPDSSSYKIKLSDVFTSITIAAWMHLKMTWDFSVPEVRFWINGVEQLTTSNLGTPIATIKEASLYIGVDGALLSNSFITDFLFYPYVDTSTTHYTKSRPWFDSNEMLGDELKFKIDNNKNLISSGASNFILGGKTEVPANKLYIGGSVLPSIDHILAGDDLNV